MKSHVRTQSPLKFYLNLELWTAAPTQGKKENMCEMIVFFQNIQMRFYKRYSQLVTGAHFQEMLFKDKLLQ